MEWFFLAIFIYLIVTWPEKPRYKQHTHARFDGGTIDHFHEAPIGAKAPYFHTHDHYGNYIPLDFPQHHYHHLVHEQPPPLQAEVTDVTRDDPRGDTS